MILLQALLPLWLVGNESKKLLVSDDDHVNGSTKRWNPMKLMKCIIRPNKLEEVREALEKLNVSGMTVSEVRGHGRQKGHKAIYRGREYSVTLLPKMMIEMVLPDDLVDEVLKVIIETARTGEIGDGRIFVLPVEQGYNIRTGERDIT
jgi:nitrogen regulatory protein P-II 1